MSSQPRCDASSSIVADQSNQSSSSVSTSSSTLASTSVAMSPSRQLHDLIGRQSAGGASTHVLDDFTPAGAMARAVHFRNPHGVSVDREFDLRVGKEPKLLANVHWNGDLSLARDPHVILLPVRVIPGPF